MSLRMRTIFFIQMGVCVNKHLTAFLSEYIVVYTVHMYNLCVQRGFRLVVGPDIFI